MFHDQMPPVSASEVEAVVGWTTFERAQDYARGRVLSLAWNPQTQRLEGRVRGHGSVYDTTAVFADEWGLGAEFTGGICSCPMRADCKHVAALVLAAAATQPGRFASSRWTAGSRQHHDALAPVSWRTAVESLLPTVATGRAESTPLAMQLSIQPAFSHIHHFSHGTPTARPSPRLHATLARPGRGGWVNGGLTWDKLTVGSDGGRFATGQVHALQALYALAWQAGNGAGMYGSVRSIELTSIDNPQFWSVFDDIGDSGVAVVGSAADAGTIDWQHQAHVVLDVTSTDDDTLTMTSTVRLQSSGVLRPLTFLGNPAHGVVLTLPGDQPVDVAKQVFLLARLTTTASPAILQAALDGHPLPIPRAELDAFTQEVWPRLRHVATITSSDGAFTQPTISAPTLVLQAAFGVDHAVDLVWHWRYAIDGRHVDVASDREPAVVGYRDPAAEQALLDGLATDIDAFWPGGRPSSARPGDLPPDTTLWGMATAAVATEVLPLLDELPDVVVEVTGTPADFREVSDSLVIGVSTETIDGDADWFGLGIHLTVEGRDLVFSEVFSALATDQPHLLLDDGAYLSLDKPELRELRRLIQEARTLQDRPAGPLRLSRFQADLWAELAAIGVVTHQADAWQEQVEGLLDVHPPGEVAVPAQVMATLRPYQEEGFAWLAFLWRHRLGGILADDMGLGKTIQTLALIAHARQGLQDGQPPFLVLAPSSVVSNWAAEASRFTPDLRVAVLDRTLGKAGVTIEDVAQGADIVITSYTLFRLDNDDHRRIAWAGMVLDEAQAAKNHRSKLYGCIRKLDTPFKLAITGTPMENNLMELWSLLSMTAPGLFPNPTTFKEFYANPIERHGDADLLRQLRRRIRPLMTRRTKDQVASDLPEKQEQVIAVDLHPAHRKIYTTRLQRERQRILGLIDDVQGNRFTILRSLTIMRQLCLHAALVDDRHEGVKSAKLDSLVSHLHEVVEGGHRALVFSQFTGFLAHVRQRLDAEGIGYSYLDGSTRNRGKVVEGFKSGDHPVFVISLKAGGVGLNLTEADYCFLLDPWWNPATEAQAIDRTHRIGQTRNVMVYRLIAADTIEEKVLALSQRKRDLFDGVMDEGQVFSGTLSVEDIRQLVE